MALYDEFTTPAKVNAQIDARLNGQKGSPNGVVQLNSEGKIDPTQLPPATEYQGLAIPSTVPTASQLEHSSKWDTTTAGEYPDMGNIEITAPDLADGRQIQIVYTKATDSWSKQFVGQNLGGYAQKTEVQKSVEFSELSVVQGKNLIDFTKVIEGSYYSNSTGNVINQIGWIRTPYIRINPDTFYSISGISSEFVGNVYDESLTRIQTLGGTGVIQTTFSFTSHSDAYYIGLNVKSPAGSTVTQPQLESGPESAFEEYSLLVPENKLEGERSDELYKTDNILFKSYNLVDPSSIVPSSYYRFSNGWIAADSLRRRLPYIEVKPNTTYSISGVNVDFIGNEYDESLTRVATIGSVASGQTSIVFTTSATTKFLGINITSLGGTNTDYDNTVQLAEASEVLPYQKPGYLVSASAIFPAPSNSPSSQNPPIFYSYISADSSVYVYVKTKIDETKYVRYQIIHDDNPGTRADLWRVRLAAVYTYDGTNFSASGINVLQGGESEFALFENGKSDYTGGWHGDEELLSVSFYANGLPISIASDIPITPARTFHYIQRSELLETDNSTRTVLALHDKNTQFLNGGYKTFNRIEWSLSRLIDLTYFGIVSVSPDVSDYFMADNSVSINSNQDGNRKINQLGGSKIWYWHAANSIAAYVESRITKISDGSEDQYKLFDNGVNLEVWDNTVYAKYYRRLQNKTPQVGDVWEGETIVEL